MNKKTFAILPILLFIAHSRISCDQIITFFFRPYPKTFDETKTLKKINKLVRPEKQAQYAAEVKLSKLKNYLTAGIFCEYNGYLAISDLNGQIIFPRRHKNNKVNILVTDIIFPVFIVGNTIHHWEIEKGNPTQMYSIERKQDTEIGSYFWKIKKVDLPQNLRIDVETIVIMAKPKYIYIPEGITLTTKNIQLKLPDIYVKSGINKALISLYTFGIKNFFKTMDFLYKKGTKRYSQIMRDVAM